MIFHYRNEVGVSATITLPVQPTRLTSRPKRNFTSCAVYNNEGSAKLRHMSYGETNLGICDTEAIPIDQNIDNEEDEITDCLNEEVESFFNSKSQQPDSIQLLNR